MAKNKTSPKKNVAKTAPAKAKGAQVAKPTKKTQPKLVAKAKSKNLKKPPVLKAQPKVKAPQKKPETKHLEKKAAPIAESKKTTPAIKGKTSSVKSGSSATPAKSRKNKRAEHMQIHPTLHTEATILLSKSRRNVKGVSETSHHGMGVCREVACELVSTTGGYCRMHYIKNWKKIKRKELILKEKKLNNYIEELVSKYPDKYIEAIKQDLTSEKDFSKVIADLEIDEGMDDFEEVETESAEALIDNIKRDFDDEGDVF